MAKKILLQGSVGVERSLHAFGSTAATAPVTLYFGVARESADRNYTLLILEYPGFGGDFEPLKVDVPGCSETDGHTVGERRETSRSAELSFGAADGSVRAMTAAAELFLHPPEVGAKS